MFGALARVVLPWGNDSFPGGSIGERVLRGPARKGPTAPQREGWGAPAPATPSIPTIVLLFTLLPLPRLCPGHCRGCATSHAAAFPAQPNHTHTGGKRVGAPEVPPSATTTPSLPLLYALQDEESGSRGCLGASLGWFFPGAMVPFRGDPSVSVFCVGLPGKGSRQCRERGGAPPMLATPQCLDRLFCSQLLPLHHSSLLRGRTPRPGGAATQRFADAPSCAAVLAALLGDCDHR